MNRPALIALVSLSLMGCAEEPSIRAYTVPHRDAAQVEISVPMARAKQRLLGAIAPRDDGQTWFVKLLGPVEQVDEVAAKNFAAFVKSLRFTDRSEDAPVAWKLPEGWAKLPNDKFSYAAFEIPAEGKPLKLTVTRAAGGLLENVNRWRGQIGLKPLTEELLPKAYTETEVGGAKVFTLDLLGPGAARPAGGM